MCTLLSGLSIGDDHDGGGGTGAGGGWGGGAGSSQRRKKMCLLSRHLFRKRAANYVLSVLFCGGLIVFICLSL